jgi:hypothetical protein
MDPDEGLRRFRVAQRSFAAEEVAIRSEGYATASSRRVAGLIQQSNAVHRGQRPEEENVQIVHRFYHVAPPPLIHVRSDVVPRISDRALPIMAHHSAFSADDIHIGFTNNLQAAEIGIHEGIAAKYRARPDPGVLNVVAPTKFELPPDEQKPAPNEKAVQDAEEASSKNILEGADLDDSGIGGPGLNDSGIVTLNPNAAAMRAMRDARLSRLANFGSPSAAPLASPVADTDTTIPVAPDVPADVGASAFFPKTEPSPSDFFGNANDLQDQADAAREGREDQANTFDSAAAQVFNRPPAANPTAAEAADFFTQPPPNPVPPTRNTTTAEFFAQPPPNPVPPANPRPSPIAIGSPESPPPDERFPNLRIDVEPTPPLPGNGPRLASQTPGIFRRNAVPEGGVEPDSVRRGNYVYPPGTEFRVGGDGVKYIVLDDGRHLIDDLDDAAGLPPPTPMPAYNRFGERTPADAYLPDGALVLPSRAPGSYTSAVRSSLAAAGASASAAASNAAGAVADIRRRLFSPAAAAASPYLPSNAAAAGPAAPAAAGAAAAAAAPPSGDLVADLNGDVRAIIFALVDKLPQKLFTQPQVGNLRISLTAIITKLAAQTGMTQEQVTTAVNHLISVSSIYNYTEKRKIIRSMIEQAMSGGPLVGDSKLPPLAGRKNNPDLRVRDIKGPVTGQMGGFGMPSQKRSRFEKGSPEAKAFMAELRAKRKKTTK